MSSRSSAWPSRLEWGLIVAFWTVFALFSIGRGVLDPHDGGASWARAPGVAVRVGTEYLFWVLLTPVAFRLVEAFPVERPRAMRNALFHTGIALCAAIGVDGAEEAFRLLLLGNGDLDFLQNIRRLWFLNELMVYVIILLVGFTRSYYLQKKERQEEAERLEQRTQSLEAQLTEARLEALRMQLNPHFLFNTLHAISTLVDRDPGGVRRMIARLSELLRHVLDEEAPQEVPLSQELDFLDDYLEIQSIRFQGRLDIETDVPAEIQEAQVPNLILQPIVENALKHGASQVRGVGRIEIEGRREKNRLILSVRDNGPGLPPSQEDGLGLRNVRARLQELYGDEQALHLEPAPEEGTVATLQLPYHTSEDLYTAASATTTLTAAPSN